MTTAPSASGRALPRRFRASAAPVQLMLPRQPGPRDGRVPRTRTTGIAMMARSASIPRTHGCARAVRPRPMGSRVAALRASCTVGTRTVIGAWHLPSRPRELELTLVLSSSDSCNGVDLGEYDMDLHIVALLCAYLSAFRWQVDTDHPSPSKHSSHLVCNRRVLACGVLQSPASWSFRKGLLRGQALVRRAELLSHQYARLLMLLAIVAAAPVSSSQPLSCTCSTIRLSCVRHFSPASLISSKLTRLAGSW